MSTTYKVEGMTCEGCATAVANAIRAAAPDSTVAVDLPGGRVTVDGATATMIRGAVERAGFTFAGIVPSA